MENIKAITNEIKDLRGSTVSVFGQQQEIKKEVSPYTVDVLEVLNSLSSYEVDGNIEKYDSEIDDYIECETNDIEEYLEFCNELCGGIKEVKHDNSYNWNANISNDIDFIIYECRDANTFYVKLMVHKYGDVRSNYTDYALLEFSHIDEFIQVIADNYKLDTVTIDDKDYNLFICPLNESIEVSIDEEEIGTICGSYDTVEEVIEDIKDLLIEA